MFAKGNRFNAIIFCWFLWLLFCLMIIVFGVVIFNHWWSFGLTHLNQQIIGAGIILAGFFIGYFATIKLFWVTAMWLSKNNYINLKTNRTISKGPRIVVVGGGTGLGTILRGLKKITSHLTAIVTVADDGGSSGRLRQEFGILPPGDIRSCLVAMADLEPLMERLMQYRFGGDSGLSGHNFGNLFLAAMTDVTGDFETAIKESSKVLAVRGQVLPATLQDVALKAELADGSIIHGESNISKSRAPIKKVYLEPETIQPVPEAITAINEADIVILGPGSLFTSIIPNLLVKDIANAIKNSPATKIYICNAMTQPGETEKYTASDHIKSIISHTGPGLMDIALVNTEEIPQEILDRYAEEGADPVLADLEKIKQYGVTPLGTKIIVKSNVIRHDADKLAKMIFRLSRTQKFGHRFGRFLIKQFYRLIKGFSVIALLIPVNSIKKIFMR